MSGATFTIGEAAERAGVSPDTLRYYERVGLIGSAPRGTNGYRYYSAALVDRVLFIRNAIRFGFSVKDLAVFIKTRDSGRPPCHAVRAEGARLLAEMDSQLAELTAARAAMAATLAAWDSRLAQTSEGAPAHLLSTPAPTAALGRGRFTPGAAGRSRRPREGSASVAGGSPLGREFTDRISDSMRLGPEGLTVDFDDEGQGGARSGAQWICREDPMNVLVRPFVERDAEQLVDILTRNGQFGHPEVEGIAAMRRVASCEAAVFLVADVDGQTEGLIRAVYDGSRALIHLLSVSPSSQQRGIGRALVNAVQSELRRRGAPTVSVTVTDASAGFGKSRASMPCPST